MDKAIVVNRLVKDFEVTVREKGLAGSLKSFISPIKRTVHALKSVSFSLDEGELIGFIGPNGAGKTTALKTLSGLLYPTSGFVSVLGYDPWDRKPEFLKKIALVMGQKNQLWWDLPAIETFNLNRAIYEIPKKEFEKNLSGLIELLGIEKLINIQVRRLSLGQRMRMELVAALLHRPRILFLDEPTLGLDLIGQQKIRDFIYKYCHQSGATIILTSHNMSDLTNLVKRVIVINEGEIFFDGAFSELTARYAKKKFIKVSFSAPGDIKKLELIGKLIYFSYPEATLSVPREAAPMASAEILQNFAVSDLTVEELPVENVIRKVFREKTGRMAGK